MERYTVAKESNASCREIVEAIRARLAGADETSVSHEELKHLTNDVRAVVRTGEFTPYANVILYSGVVFSSA